MNSAQSHIIRALNLYSYILYAWRVNEKIITTEDLYQGPLKDLLETHRRLIGDQDILSKTHWRPTCLIKDRQVDQ